MTTPPPPLAPRARALARLGERRFDLLVVGGGITGAGIARDAARRGLEVALVEQHDFAAGTSSRSSRLVHGGVRYLEHGHLRLVFEASRERHTLLRMAPHLVRPLRFTWPVFAGARMPRWKLSAGLALYDALSLFRNVGSHRTHWPSAIRKLEPALRAEGLQGGATYWDAATDDTRLTLANVLDAALAGATVLNHARVTGLRIEHSGLVGATVECALGGQRVDVTATVVCNATGPWTDALRQWEEPSVPDTVLGSKGAHVTVPRERLGARGAITTLHPDDGRVGFILPGPTHTIVGTTETPTHESPDTVRASARDVDYLLRVANAYFPEARLTPRDVVTAWAGIRPLVAPTVASDPGAASREHLLESGPRGMLTITGGKLTTYRSMAAEAVDAVMDRLARDRGRPVTDTRPLPGGDLDALAPTEAAAVAATRDALVGRHLVRTYGSGWGELWTSAQREPRLADPIVDGLPYLLAEVDHAIEAELACTLGDVLIRRTHLAFETPDQGRGCAEYVARRMARRLGWTDRGVDAALEDYEREVSRLFTITP